MNRLQALEWQQANKLEIKVQGKKENLRRRENARKTHPRDGSLSVSNPARVFDTLSGYHGSTGRKTCEMTAEKARNE